MATLIEWRDLLRTGFDAALRASFPRGAGGPADLTIDVEQADVTATPIPREYYSFFYTLRFRIHLLDREGRCLGRSFGSVSSEPHAPLARAVELMVEASARDLFSGATLSCGPSVRAAPRS